MTQLRDMENMHHEKVSDIAVVTLEKMMKNELEEDLPDDLRMVSWHRLCSQHYPISNVLGFRCECSANLYCP